jgi:23S rRNA pseudouridine1911/1915/1917 synthase
MQSPMIEPTDATLNDDAADAQADADVAHFSFTATKTQTQRIDQFLTGRISYLSRSAVQRLIDEDLVKVNGKPTKASYKLKDGDTVDMVAPPEPVNELIPENIPLDIIYEDEHFLALNKQADLIVHPARGRWSGTLVNGLVYYGQKWSTCNGDWRPGILHRLDRNTTGVMLVAKSDEAHWRIARQFENRTIQKTYVAVVHGVPELLSDVIDMPIGKDKYIREKQGIRKEENGGRQAITKYVVEERFERSVSATLHASPFLNDRKLKAPPEKYAFVRLTPKTGRTHQLRVHMSVAGYPMVGDTMYGGRIFETNSDSGGVALRFERQALHAAEITFVHPVTLKTMTLAAPLPKDMRNLLATLRGEVIRM